MTAKRDFNAEEWESLTQGPAAAGLLVISAQRGGTIRESLELARAYAEARRERGADTLLDEVVATPPVLRPPGGTSSLEDVRARSLERVREAVRVLDRRATPEEAAEYRAFVLDLAERVADAHREGFLGMGARVSEAEREAVEDVRRALSAPA